MPIRFRCDCGVVLEVREELAGRTGTCKSCGGKILIPVRPSQFDDPEDSGPIADLAEGAMEPPPFFEGVAVPAPDTIIERPTKEPL